MSVIDQRGLIKNALIRNCPFSYGPGGDSETFQQLVAYQYGGRHWQGMFGKLSHAND